MLRYGYLSIAVAFFVTTGASATIPYPCPPCATNSITVATTSSTSSPSTSTTASGTEVCSPLRGVEPDLHLCLFHREADGRGCDHGDSRLPLGRWDDAEHRLHQQRANGHGGGPSLLQRSGFRRDIAELPSVDGLRPSLRGSSRHDGRLRHHQRNALGHADLPDLARSQQPAAVPEGLARHRYELLPGHNGVHRPHRWRSIPVLFGQQSLLECGRRTGWAQ